ncbi:hypothetical protein C8F04DRAFT_1276156 [Mycena alexandri]|uniref:Uncharacterized protein n=1 Tax=Mycena alexandri TaxID=1745969 RepID=A0AAD6S5X7_9AGAR|nr:hypothetical protein C8F04DRAFT_1276156 [Mycena alexandri]
MAAVVDPSHNTGRTSRISCCFRMFREGHGVRISTKGTKQEVALRIADKLGDFEKLGDTEAWEAAYGAWTDLKYVRFPGFKRDE